MMGQPLTSHRLRRLHSQHPRVDMDLNITLDFFHGINGYVK